MRRLIAVLVGVLAMVFFSEASLRTQDSVTASKPIQPPKNVTPAKLIHQVLPKYPKDAKKAGISGMVVLKGTITREGTVTDLEYVSGPEELTDAAIKAVTKWKYEPMRINGEPVDVSTKISVNFSLNNR